MLEHEAALASARAGFAGLGLGGTGGSAGHLRARSAGGALPLGAQAPPAAGQPQQPALPVSAAYDAFAGGGAANYGYGVQPQQAAAPPPTQPKQAQGGSQLGYGGVPSAVAAAYPGLGGGGVGGNAQLQGDVWAGAYPPPQQQPQR